MSKQFVLLLALVSGIIFCGCDFDMDSVFGAKEGSSQNPISLTVDKWTKGEIVKLKNDNVDEQWFKFVATSSTQRIYVKLSTITYLNAYLYDSEYNRIGSNLNVQGSTGKVGYTSFSLSRGKTYYIQVSGGYYGSYYTGTYWIAFNSTGETPQ